MRRYAFVLFFACLLFPGLGAQEAGPLGSPSSPELAAPASDQNPGEAAPASNTDAPEGSELEASKARIAALEEEIAGLGERLDASEAEYARIEALLEEERKARAEETTAAEKLQEDLFAAAETAGAERDQAKTELAALEAESDAALAQRDELAIRLAELELERESLADLGGAGLIEVSAFPVLLLSGFAGAHPRIGQWNIEPASASQLEGREFFSRLEIPLEQGEEPYLYRFRASTSGKGWVGLGLHLFSSGVKSRRGYGEGRSLLVWLTRDPKVRKTDATWLQLYRSDNDVVMERVVDAKLEEALSESLFFEILYDPESGYLTVQIDGRLALRYRAFFGIEKGVGIAFRSLGAGARFSEFEVRRAR